MGNIIEGKDLMVFLDVSTTSTPEYKSIAFATSHQITFDMSTTEISTKDHGSGKWTSQNPNKNSWSMQTDNLYSNDGDGVMFDDLFDIYKDQKSIKIAWALKSGTEMPTGGWTPADTRYTGEALITNLTANAADGDNASLSCSFIGRGEMIRI